MDGHSICALATEQTAAMTTMDCHTQPGKPQSLLVKALEESPGGNVPVQLMQSESQDSCCSSSNSYSQSKYPEPFIPVHSDFTIPTSNVSGLPPPPMLNSGKDRRSLFGGRVQQRYGYLETTPTAATWTNSADDRDSSHSLPSIQASPLHINSSTRRERRIENDRQVSDLTPPSSPNRSRRDILSPLTPYDTAYGTKAFSGSNRVSKRALRAHETAHAQALILGIAFMAIWSPQNLMAPNLTQMAQEFGFSDKERDVYLGANIALASGVLSLPISAFIGVLADMYNRKLLFCITVIAGGLSSWATGASTTYQALFFARLLNGGFMSGSVPVVFSLLGDLFAAGERNTASSGLTAMMGMGIIFGQVYAGVVGSAEGWSHAFYVSAVLSLVAALLVFVFVKEPVRGGQEQVLQQMLKNGTKYDRKLTFQGFIHAMKNNESNVILLWQGFASSVPWGIIFVFLNDYLSQERGFSVPDATYLVALFGAGCAIGGILGGYWGQLLMLKDRSYLPWFMSATTFLGIFPFLILLNVHFTNAHGWGAVLCALSGGLIASLPSVNIRPCLINVNPPETRGAALTAANLIINVARGAGPSCITLMGAVFQVNRQFSFNVTLSVFWTITAIQLMFLSQTLPRDEDAMEAELAQYVASTLAAQRVVEDDGTIVSIEERMTSFDGFAARESMKFVGFAFREISEEIRSVDPFHCGSDDRIDEEDENGLFDDDDDTAEVESRRKLWKQKQKEMWRQPNDAVTDESTMLLPTF